MTIETRLHELSSEVLGFDLQSYLSSNNKSLYGVEIQGQQRRFASLFGNCPQNVLTAINQKFVLTEAGYKVDLKDTFPSIGVEADLFLINSNRLTDNEAKLDALLIHELCHLLIDSSNLANSTLDIDTAAKHLGKKLYELTDKENQESTRHTIEFCEVLSAACISAESAISPKKSRLRRINDAMRFDVQKKLK